MHEVMQTLAPSWFITLTYNDENLPYAHNLNRSDLQKFIKRMRKKHGQFRYFCCGEYGDKTQRPHYHIIIFGLEIDDLFKWKKTQDGIYYISQSIAKTWGNGNIIIAPVSHKTCAYVARYSLKKLTGKLKNTKKASCYNETGLILHDEFAGMSLKPGIGYKHYDKYKHDMFKHGYVRTNDRDHPIPKFYRLKYKESYPEQYNLYHTQLLLAISESTQYDVDELAIKQRLLQKRISLLVRQI